MPLTDTAIKNAKPSDKTARLFDGGGLYLELSPTGGKWWRFKYRFAGKEKRLSLGVYPDVSLKEARQRRDDARKLLANDIDPGEHRKAVKATKSERAANSFELVAREWFAKKLPSWAPSNADKILGRLEKDAFPWLANRPISEITSPEMLKVLRRIEERGAVETAHRVRNYCGQIFRYAIATGRADRDPSFELRGALATHVKQHRAAITDPKEIGELLRAIDGYQGSFVTKCALRLHLCCLFVPVSYARLNGRKLIWRGRSGISLRKG